MNLQPINDSILVKMLKPEQKGKIIIPDSLIDDGNIAEVIAFGPFVEGVSVGQKVMVDKYAGMAVVLDGFPYLILRPIDIIAVVE